MQNATRIILYSPLNLNCMMNPRNVKYKGCFHHFSRINSKAYSSEEKVSCRNKVINEGLAKIEVPENKVFYNPAQLLSRDLTVAVVRSYCQKRLETDPEYTFSILEPFAASGLRSFRFAKEVPSVKHVLANDFSVHAYEAIQKNITLNNLCSVVHTTNKDASELMGQRRCLKDRFDVIDLDPYGTVSRYIDGAVSSVKHGGLLCMSSTDSAVLSAKDVSVCWARYQAIPIPGFAIKEQALRVLLHAISITAARRHLYIEPLLSVNFGFYIRLFVKVHKGKEGANLSAKNHIYVKHCNNSPSYFCQPIVQHQVSKCGKEVLHPSSAKTYPSYSVCDNSLMTGGPFWGGPLHNPDFVRDVKKSFEKNDVENESSRWILAMLSSISEELCSVPFYYKNDNLAAHFKKNTLRVATIKRELERMGYKMSSFHAEPKAVKTDAPPHILLDLVQNFSATDTLASNKTKETAVQTRRSKKPSRNPPLPKHWFAKKKVEL